MSKVKKKLTCYTRKTSVYVYTVHVVVYHWRRCLVCMNIKVIYSHEQIKIWQKNFWSRWLKHSVNGEIFEHFVMTTYTKRMLNHWNTFMFKTLVKRMISWKSDLSDKYEPKTKGITQKVIDWRKTSILNIKDICRIFYSCSELRNLWTVLFLGTFTFTYYASRGTNKK